MKTKTVSQIDQNGYYVGEAIAYESPREPGAFLIPGGAIDREPPRTIEPGKRYRPWGTGWRAEDIPAPPAPEPEPEPETAPEPPPPPPPTPQQIRRGEIAARLLDIDQASIRPARAVAAALAAGKPAPTFDANRLAALETEAAALRAEMAGITK